MAAEAAVEPIRVVGRYALYDPIAAGGMATVHYGRLRGPVGFARTVAIKRLHPELARDPEFVSMFLDEARLAARIRHPNVVQTLDVVAEDGELFLIMEYVQGESLARLRRSLAQEQQVIPHRIASAIMSGALMGLHAAHEAKNEQGERLGLVHRDVSPHNVLVGADGMARVLDFGVAKAAGRVHTTREGKVKGKLAYMAPEQIQSGEVTREADLYSATVVLWEALTGKRLFHADNQTTVVARILAHNVPPPSKLVPGLPSGYDAIIAKGMAKKPSERYASAREMALALEGVDGVESPARVAAWLEARAGTVLEERAERIANIERGSDVSSVSEFLIGAAAAPADPQSSSGIVSVRPEPAASKLKLVLAAGAGLGVLLLIAGVLLARALHEPEPQIEAMPSPIRSAAPAATVTGKAPPEPVASAVAEPEPPVSAAASASAAPKPKRPAYYGGKRSPSTTSGKSGKTNPFADLGGRL